MWKWRELLPLPKAPSRSAWRAGNAADPARSCGAKHGTLAPIVKDEGRLPTGSFKARGMAARSAWRSISA
jgi:threonine synthase